jgi:DNA-binding XRE family transcriptional regulator
MTINYWEISRNQPSLRMIPRIVDFLGYNPNLEAQPDETPGERIVRVRWALGVRQKDLARQLGVDPTTLARWERGEREPSHVYLRRLKDLFATAPPTGHLQAVVSQSDSA